MTKNAGGFHRKSLPKDPAERKRSGVANRSRQQ